MTAAVVLIGIVTMITAYLAIAAGITAEENEKRVNEFLVQMEHSITRLDSEIASIRRELSANEQSHGVLAMQIKELSSLEKTEELRKEVLHLKGGS